ncbi:Plasma membrane sulfite pump involved in sulfite metabolism [Metarhizium acridum]|uniref:Plasma membrane sulfite pump involved in sulfite metabolism n=1 Tax=Metarhizium acridum TaxID=92637 RepID=UPI001C6CF321|nr:Plasma membrane sulfite pump involved in sulfite metabolism [Metarhizium acridum]
MASMHVHDPKLPSTTAVWLRPIAPTIAAFGTGAKIAQAFTGMAYILWGTTTIPLSMTCRVLCFHRLTMHNPPPREAIISAVIAATPLGERFRHLAARKGFQLNYSRRRRP